MSYPSPFIFFVLKTIVFTCTIRYWVDKWAVLRVYGKPPLYGHKMFAAFDELLFLMLTVHM